MVRKWLVLRYITPTKRIRKPRVGAHYSSIFKLFIMIEVRVRAKGWGKDSNFLICTQQQPLPF